MYSNNVLSLKMPLNKFGSHFLNDPSTTNSKPPILICNKPELFTKSVIILVSSTKGNVNKDSDGNLVWYIYDHSKHYTFPITATIEKAIVYPKNAQIIINKNLFKPSDITNQKVNVGDKLFVTSKNFENVFAVCELVLKIPVEYE